MLMTKRTRRGMTYHSAKLCSEPCCIRRSPSQVYILGKPRWSDGELHDALPIISSDGEPTSVAYYRQNINMRRVFKLPPGATLAPVVRLYVKEIGDKLFDMGGDWVCDANGKYMGEWL